jgi:hypothetical protein
MSSSGGFALLLRAPQPGEVVAPATPAVQQTRRPPPASPISSPAFAALTATGRPVRPGHSTSPNRPAQDSTERRQAQLPTWPRLEKETPNYPPRRQTLESHVRRQFPETETKSL